jgi:hypothetical protein
MRELKPNSASHYRHWATPITESNWLLRLAALDPTICRRFIDPYGTTVFNSLQIPALQAELSALAGRLGFPPVL